MGVLVLMIVGAVLGWLFSIIVDLSDTRRIALNVGAGMVGSLIVGSAVGGRIAMNGLTTTALLLACIGAVALVTTANYVGKHALD
ncbi:GlsB/YeaQ/YmgE family stress response membrane protein [Altererythrobacter aurantiacus]|uniref:GlsB/YeaQ/YmgE family stress response membrane protein n=1 Tax=Parapontixanthobacter aurantiacus TaxID=1463599 RepID=A0A844ZFS1_9SPHN|nr:GlsB/YeaQ/YmgE family stress response membrane protein [Parapontixanthobacter aurantiacus]MXO86705.1 GlsB/YeaQ/YmgE family stress response membrane protein [Parapontixanthobacter aurantiacus]